MWSDNGNNVTNYGGSGGGCGVGGTKKLKK